ncbi:hypothetical protein Mgra_00007384 [Meloidogyne graminicola]|uniref:Uncharacterized protein n=1 Tax=Meloidogyne graminicola TaxID=189291 RepID=A0A8S9ZIL4_9BILA|nr:hypothetical protein Mgra_00007384 [Meloidogyne graminicola]
MSENLEKLTNNSKDWTLKDDIELKNILQEYSHNLIKTTKEINDGTESLNDSLCKIDIRLSNINNKLNYAKMKRLIDEKVDDISLDSLLQKNQRLINEKKNQTKEEFEQHTIRTISSSIMKAFQKISETSIPDSNVILNSDPLDPCSNSLLNNSVFTNIEMEKFVKICKLPPIIGSKESFNYLNSGKDNKKNINSYSFKNSKQVTSFKEEDVQSTSSGRSIPPQDPNAGLNQNNIFNQMALKIAEKRREVGIEQENSENFSQKLLLENSGKTSNTSPSLSSLSYETSTSSRPINGQKSNNIIYSIDEKIIDNSSLYSLKQTEIVKNTIKVLPKNRDDELFSTTESDDSEDNLSITSNKTKKSFTLNDQKIYQIKDDKFSNLSNSACSKSKVEKHSSTSSLAHSNNQLPKQDKPSEVSDSNKKECNKVKEFSSKNAELFGLIAQIGNKIPIHLPDEIIQKEIEPQNKTDEEKEKPSKAAEQLEILKGRAKGPSARRIPTNFGLKLQTNTLVDNHNENKIEDKKRVEVLNNEPKQIKEIEIPKQQTMLSKNDQPFKSSLISSNKTSTAKISLSIFSSSSDDDFDLNIKSNSSQSSKIVKKQQQIDLSKTKVDESILEKKTQTLGKQYKPEISKQRKGLFDDSDSDF